MIFVFRDSLTVLAGLLDSFAIEEFDQSRPVMLLDHINNRLAKLVFPRFFDSVLNMRLKYQSAHAWLKLIVNVRPTTLVLDEI